MKCSWWLACCAILPLMLIAGCAHPPAPPAVRGERAVRFLLANDVYVADTLSDGQGGLARVATLRKQLQAAGPILFVLAGDVLSPSLLSKYYRGEQMLEGFNAAGLDYATFGNHEFELDRDTLVDRISRSRFRWLSANCTEAGGAPFPGVRPWDTLTISGVRVGLFGVTLQGDYRRYVACGPVDSAAHRAIAELDRAGAELIVGVTHQILEADRALLTAEPRLDLILGGHEHEAHDTVVNGRHTAKADANVRTVRIVTVNGGPGAWQERVELKPIDRGLPDDSTVAQVTARWGDSLRTRLGPERNVATAAEPIDARDAVQRSRESVLGDVVTDAMRAGTGADVALMNAGTMRLDDVIQPGRISSYQLESIFLFSDEARIVTFPLTGARVRALLEHSVSDKVLGRGGFLQVSGIAFTYSRRQPDGQRVQSVLRADGRPLTPDDTVRVAFDVYPACDGGDGYVVPEAVGACRDRSSGPRSVDLLIRYIQDSLGGRIVKPAGGRIEER